MIDDHELEIQALKYPEVRDNKNLTLVAIYNLAVINAVRLVLLTAVASVCTNG